MAELPNNSGRRGFMTRFLDIVERGGNKLPQPVTLFFILMFVVLFLSWIFGGVSVPHPANPDDKINVVNLLSRDGFQMIMTRMVSTFALFPPLGLVLVVMLGIGVAEYTGMFKVGLRLFVSKVPKSIITFSIVVAGMVSSVAADAGYVVLIPLGGAIFMSMGRHPLAGIAAAFAGVSGGFGANFLPTGLDPMIAAFTEPAARIIDPSYTVNPLSNYYLMAASVPLIGLVGTWVTEKILVPRLGPYKPTDDIVIDEETPVTPRERKAIKYSIVASLAVLSLVLYTIIPANGILRGDVEVKDRITANQEEPGKNYIFSVSEELVVGPEESTPQILMQPDGSYTFSSDKPGNYTYDVTVCHEDQTVNCPTQTLTIKGVRSFDPFYKSLVPIMFIVFLVAGLVYGIIAKTIRNDKDVSDMAAKSMATMGLYIVIAFVAAQFVAYFNWSNLGSVLAVKGSDGLKAIGFTGAPLLVAFIIVSSIVNLVMGSASAKWALLAPIFVPMLMLMGYSPETTQAAYRIGDSYSNILTPLLPYFPIVIVFAQKYVKNVGIGTLIAMMLPYSIAFALVRIPMLIAWIYAGLPLGIEGPIYYNP